MIKLNNIGTMKKGNLWIDEPSDIVYESNKILEIEMIKDNWKKWEDISLAIELFLKNRHASNYVLLGFNYKYEHIGKLKVKVKSSIYDGTIVENTLVSERDEVHAGIPQEYAEQILEVANECLSNIGCSEGTITFDIGAHGYIGSSKAIFGIATEILLKLLNEDNKSNIENLESVIFKQLNTKI